MSVTSSSNVAQMVFELFFILSYDMFYMSLPVIFMGMLVQDVNALRYPQLYTPGLEEKLEQLILPQMLLT